MGPVQTFQLQQDPTSKTNPIIITKTHRMNWAQDATWTSTFVAVRNISVGFQIFLQKRGKFQVRQCFCSSIMLFYHQGRYIFKYYFMELVVLSSDSLRKRKTEFVQTQFKDKSRQFLEERNQITVIQSDLSELFMFSAKS